MPKINQLTPATSLANTDLIITDTNTGSNTRNIQYANLRTQIQNESASVFAAHGEIASDQQVATAVGNWLDANVTPTGSAVAIDDTLLISGAAADAQATGKMIVINGTSAASTRVNITTSDTDVELAEMSDVNELKNAYNNCLIYKTSIEQGYYAIADGTPSTSPNWCRSIGYVENNNIFSISGAYYILLLAYKPSGEYVGAWTGSAFEKTLVGATMHKSIDLYEISKDYTGYVFRLVFYKDGTAIIPQDISSALTVKKALNPIKAYTEVHEIGKLVYFPVKTGEVFTIASLTGDAMPLGGRLALYNSNGEYINYYGLAGLVSRTITSSIDFYYVTVIDATSISMSIEKATYFGTDEVNAMLSAIGNNRNSIVDLEKKTYLYGDEKAETEAVVRKYDTASDSTPVYCDTRFLWISDIHKEIDRTEHFAEIVKKFGTDLVPFVLNTGDTVENVISDGISWYNDIIAEMNVPVLNVVGNHDAYITNGVYENDKTVVYNEIIDPFVSDWNVVQPTGAKTNGYNYYYKELSANIRLIVLDSAYWDSTQKTWFDTLLADSLTNDKHVLVACHYPFNSDICTMVESNWNTGWLSRDSSIMNVEAMQSVQSFISNGGIFIAWLQGHVHGDEIVTLDSGKQLAICTNSFSNRGTKVYKTSNDGNYNYNSYTIVAIDTEKTLFKMYRIGADISVTGRKHNGFVWDYTNKEVFGEW